MTDRYELKRLADELIAANDLFNESPQDNEVGDVWSLANDRFTEAASPEVIVALIAENEALRKDAERYRWLRDSSESIHQFYLSTPIWFTGVKFSKENVDSTIDAAMREEPQP